MPALFSKDDILNGEEREEIIYFSELYELPEDIDGDPYIKFKIDDKVREHQERMYKKYIEHRIISYGKDNKRFQVVSPGKLLEYVMELLRVAMVETEYLFDDPSLPIIRKKLKRSKVATKFIAEKMTSLIENDVIKIKEREEEDEKN